MNNHLHPLFQQILAPYAAPARRKPVYRDEIDVRIAGIPAKLGILHFEVVVGSFSYDAPSDLDYRGYIDIDYDVLDRNGRPAKWLEKKIDDDIERELRETIIEFYS